MKAAVTISLTLLLCPLMAAAQARGQEQTPVQEPGDAAPASAAASLQAASLHAIYSNVSGCPVSLRAQQVASGNTMEVNQTQPRRVGQRLYFILGLKEAKQPTNATFVVRGPAREPHSMNAAYPSRERSSVRTVRAALRADEDGNATADVPIPDMTAVQIVDLVSLTYADGSAWQLGEGASCRIAPDARMLVSVR